MVRRLLGIGVALALMYGAYAAIDWRENRRRGVEVLDAVVIDPAGTHATFTLASCNARTSIEVRERIHVVEVAGFARGMSDDDCADGESVVLDRPIGGRVVVDAKTALAVDVSAPGRVAGGDSVQVLVDRRVPAPLDTAAFMVRSRAELDRRWRALGASGPPPGVDFGERRAMVVTIARPVECPGHAVVSHVHRGAVLVKIAEEAGPAEVAACHDGQHAQLLVLAIATAAADSVTHALLHGTEVPLR